MPVYCSDLVRAHQTAERIAAVWGLQSPTVHDDKRLRELHLGEYEGRSWADFLADAALNAAMTAEPFNTVLPDGESVAQMQTRVLAAVHDIVDRHGDCTATAQRQEVSSVPRGALMRGESAAAACVVAHDGPLRTILNHYLGVSPEKWWALTTTHGGISLLEWTDGWVNVRFINDISHLAVCGAAPTAGGAG